MKSCFDVLNIQPGASRRQARLAWRRAAMKYHPDRASPDADADRFKQASDAYEEILRLSAIEEVLSFIRQSTGSSSHAQAQQPSTAQVATGLALVPAYSGPRTQSCTQPLVQNRHIEVYREISNALQSSTSHRWVA